MLVSDTGDEDAMQFYVADIPTSLLEKLAQPSLNASKSVGRDGVTSSNGSGSILQVVRHEISTTPHHSLRDRLLEHISASMPRTTEKSSKDRRREGEDEDRQQGGVKRRLDDNENDGNDDRDHVESKRRKIEMLRGVGAGRRSSGGD